MFQDAVDFARSCRSYWDWPTEQAPTPTYTRVPSWRSPILELYVSKGLLPSRWEAKRPPVEGVQVSTRLPSWLLLVWWEEERSAKVGGQDVTVWAPNSCRARGDKAATQEDDRNAVDPTLTEKANHGAEPLLGDVDVGEKQDGGGQPQQYPSAESPSDSGIQQPALSP